MLVHNPVHTSSPTTPGSSMVCHYFPATTTDNTSIVAHRVPSQAASCSSMLVRSNNRAVGPVFTNLPVPESEHLGTNSKDLTSNLAHRGAGNIYNEYSIIAHQILQNNNLFSLF